MRPSLRLGNGRSCAGVSAEWHRPSGSLAKAWHAQPDDMRYIRPKAAGVLAIMRRIRACVVFGLSIIGLSNIHARCSDALVYA